MPGGCGTLQALLLVDIIVLLLLLLLPVSVCVLCRLVLNCSLSMKPRESPVSNILYHLYYIIYYQRVFCH